MGILEHHAERSSQIRLLDLIDIDAVIADLAVCDIVETVDQVGDRHLARAGSADKGDLLPRFCIKADVVQDDLVVVIAEVHIVEDDAALLLCISDRPLGFVRVLPRPKVRSRRRFCQNAVLILFRIDQLHIPFVRFRLLIHQVEDTMSSRRCIDDKVDLLADLRDRVGKALIQSDKGDYRADGNARQSVYAQDRSQDRHQRIADPSDISVDRHQKVGVAVRLVRTLSQPFIHLMEVLHRRFFMAEDFDNLLPVQHLFDKSIHSPQIDLLTDIIPSGQLREIGRHKEHDGGRENGDHRQRRVQDDHRDQRRRHGDNRVDNLRDALAQELTQRVNIVRIHGHNVAVCVRVEVFDRQGFHSPEEVVSQVKQRPRISSA